MSESGGRRIKRSLYLDQNSIKFCSPEQLDHFKTFELLTGYLNDKITEVDASNSAKNINMDAQVNGRRLTNIGTFRAYIQAYLKNHSKIHDELTFLIRQLSPSERGLPIEIYVFTNITDWIEYEGIQADIFDHLLSVIPEFGLRIFQNPTGKDFKKIVS
jgi:miniconductance mechanosensitive channel